MNLSDPSNPQPQPAAAPSTNPPSDSQQAVTNAPAITTPTQTPQTSQQPAPGSSQAAQPKTAQPSQDGTVTNAPVHPSVQHAGVIRQVAEALAGGPRFTTTIDPQTGATTRTRVPLSSRDIGMAIAMEALSGGIAGLGQRGPGATGRAAEAGFQQVSQQQQQAEQERQAQAQQQQQNETQALVRKANAYEANSRTVLNTSQAERYGVESLKDAVTQNAQLLSDYQDAGAVSESNISQDALQAGIQSGKYDATAQIAVPDGFTNINGRYEQTFSIVANPAAKIPLTTEQAKAFADAGVPGFAPFKTGNIPNGVEVPGYMIANANQRVQAINLMKSDFSAVSDALARSGDKGNQELAKSIPNVQDLLNDKSSGPVLNNALSKFQRYVSHSDQHGMDFYESLQQMAAPSKADPRNPKKFIPNPDSGAASVIAGAFGNGDPQKGWAILKAYHAEATPEPVTNETQAETVLADPNSSSKAKVQARNFLQIGAQQKAREAGAEASAKKAVTDADASGVSDPALGRLISPANVGADGVNHAFLSAVQQKNPERASLIQSIGQGRTLLSTYGLSKKDGQALVADVAAAYPGFDQSKVGEYTSAVKDFGPGGKSGKNLISLNTALTHLQRSYDNVGMLTSTPGLSTVGSWLGVKGAGAYKADVNALASEIATAYKGGVPDKEEVNRWYNAFTALNPNTVRNAYSEAANLLLNKVSEMHDRWNDSVPSSFVPQTQFITDAGAQSFKHVTGQDVPSELRQKSHANPSSAVQGLTNFQTNPKTGQRIGWNGSAWVDANTGQAVK